MSRWGALFRLTAALAVCGSASSACREPGPRHREHDAGRDAQCTDPARPRAFFYPAENRTDYAPDHPDRDGCALLVADHLFCCPDVRRATDR